ncbi:hypothetical protein H0H92_010862, partial [Tricholoma furcatifolium]
LLAMPHFTFNFMPEIDEQIFEWAARMFPDEAHKLVLISRRIQKLVEPVLYENLTFLDATYSFAPKQILLDDFLYTLETRPSQFFAKNVHNVFFHNPPSSHLFQSLLSKCTGLRHAHIIDSFSDKIRLAIGTPLLLSASTLTSIYTSRQTLCTMFESQVIFPNLEYVGLECDYYPPLPTCTYAPSLSKLEMELWLPPDPLDPLQLCLKDIETAISTAPLLTSIFLIIEDHLEFKKVLRATKHFNDGVDVVVIQDDLGLKVLMDNWKMRIHGDVD